ncbi:MAG: hypothetical protein ACYC5F_00240 [Thermoleophilia bacterium]
MNQDELNDAAFALRAWQEAMANLAESIVWFQHIEATLSICSAIFADMEEEIGEIVTSEMSFRARVATLSAPATHHSATDYLHDDIKGLLRRLRWAEEERNRLVHSMWDLNGKKPGAIQRTKKAIRKNKHREEFEDFVPDDLQDLRNLFEGINTDLVYLLSKHYPRFRGQFHY